MNKLIAAASLLGLSVNPAFAQSAPVSPPPVAVPAPDPFVDDNSCTLTTNFNKREHNVTVTTLCKSAGVSVFATAKGANGKGVSNPYPNVQIIAWLQCTSKGKVEVVNNTPTGLVPLNIIAATHAAMEAANATRHDAKIKCGKKSVQLPVRLERQSFVPTT